MNVWIIRISLAALIMVAQVISATVLKGDASSAASIGQLTGVLFGWLAMQQPERLARLSKPPPKIGG